MESTSYDNILVFYKIQQWIEGINNILIWNENTDSVDDFTGSFEGMKTLAATSMILESIGEGIKKVDEITNGTLFILRPDIPWRKIKGMRNHIAHGYFDINAEFIFDVVKNHLFTLKSALIDLQAELSPEFD